MQASMQPSSWATNKQSPEHARIRANDMQEEVIINPGTHHEEIRQITDRLKESVEVLYREPAPGEKVQKPQKPQKPKEQPTEKKPMRHSTSNKRKIHIDTAVDSDQDPEGVEDGLDKEASNHSGSGSDESYVEDVRAEVDDIDEDWNAEQSKQQVRHLLESLKTEKRTDVMAKLHGWFGEKSKKVQTELEVLTGMEEERSAKEEDLKSAHESVQKGIEDREMRSFVTLNAFYRKLMSHSRGAELKKRSKLSKTSKGLLDKFHDQQSGEDEGSQLDVGELRAQLLDKDSPLRKCLLQASESGVGTVKASDLLEVIAVQQTEISELSERMAQNDKKVDTLKTALDHCTAQGTIPRSTAADNDAPEKEGESAENDPNSQLDPAVKEIIDQIQTEVEQQKISEIMARKDSATNEAGEKPPDESEIQALEKECSELRLQLKELDIEIKMIKTPEERERELALKLERIQNGEMDDIEGLPSANTPAGKAMAEGAGMKDKLQMELDRIQEENDQLQEQLKKYEDLMQTAEKTLRMMDEQKKVFLDSVEQAKQNLHIETLPAEELDPASQAFQVDEQEEEALDQAEQQKQQAAMEKLQEEEEALQKEVQDLEKELQGAKDRVTGEKDKQNELKQQIERQKKEYQDVAAQLEGDVPESLEAEEAEMMKLKGENEQLQQAVEDLRRRLADEERRADLDEQAAIAAENAARKELERKAQELEEELARANEEDEEGTEDASPVSPTSATNETPHRPTSPAEGEANNEEREENEKQATDEAEEVDKEEKKEDHEAQQEEELKTEEAQEAQDGQEERQAAESLEAKDTPEAGESTDKPEGATEEKETAEEGNKDGTGETEADNVNQAEESTNANEAGEANNAQEPSQTQETTGAAEAPEGQALEAKSAELEGGESKEAQPEAAGTSTDVAASPAPQGSAEGTAESVAAPSPDSAAAAAAAAPSPSPAPSAAALSEKAPSDASPKGSAAPSAGSPAPSASPAPAPKRRALGPADGTAEAKAKAKPTKVPEKPPEPEPKKNPQEQKLDEMRAQQALDMQELQKLQQENTELSKQIDVIEAKIKAVKSSKGAEVVIEKEEKKDEKEEVPAENLELRKEVRKKQRELNALRKKWWSERQDPKQVARRALMAAQNQARNDMGDDLPQGAITPGGFDSKSGTGSPIPSVPGTPGGARGGPPGARGGLGGLMPGMTFDKVVGAIAAVGAIPEADEMEVDGEEDEDE